MKLISKSLRSKHSVLKNQPYSNKKNFDFLFASIKIRQKMIIPSRCQVVVKHDDRRMSLILKKTQLT